MINLDSEDPAGLASFYSAVLGWNVLHSEADYAMIGDGSINIGFGKLPGYTAPGWPAESAPKRYHLDFYVDDLEPDVDRALDEAIATFRKLGVRIVQVDLPDQMLVSAAALIVIAVEAVTTHAPWLRTRAADYGDQIRNRLMNGLAYSSLKCAISRRDASICAAVAPLARALSIMWAAYLSAKSGKTLW